MTEGLNVETVGGETQSGDLFLLSSDELSRVVEDEALASELIKSPSAEAAGRLIATVLARATPENVSLAIVSVT